MSRNVIRDQLLSRLITRTICPSCAYRIGSSGVDINKRSIFNSAKRQSFPSSIGSQYFFPHELVREKRISQQSTRTNDEITQQKKGDVKGVDVKEKEFVQSIKVEDNVERISKAQIRRRDRLKQVNEDGVMSLPLDASSTLSTLADSAPPLSLKRQLLAYLALTKPRLATLIVLTTTASYSLYPVPSMLSSAATHTPSLSALTLLFLTTGTFSCVASANTLNMILEPRYDAQMSRTRNRPLVRGLIHSRSAIIFAILTSLLGTSVLYYGVNPTTSILGLTNILLYAFVYTPLKRISIINTWVGAIVGCIPPLMGWTAAGGHYLFSPPSSSLFDSIVIESQHLLFSSSSIGGWLLAGLLFAWQFPHFNALSHPLRHEYLQAGYKMAVSLRPGLNARVALRYSLLTFPICFALSYYDVTNGAFAYVSAGVNVWMSREAYRFWKSGGGEGIAAVKSARGLFWASVWYLPIVLVLAMGMKKGLWDGVWMRFVGDSDEEDNDDGEEEEEELEE